MDPYVGQIMVVGFNFAPKGWALCQGQLLPISQNTALFSLLGTQYGGDGRSTFGLPNLQGSIAIDQGQGTGLSPYSMGQTGGTETVTLSTQQMPAHSHQQMGTTAEVSGTSPSGNTFAQGSRLHPIPAYYVPGAGGVAMNSQQVGLAGSTQPHPNVMSYLSMYYCIALQGIFPPRP